ncbi:hypothetical protein KP79_PYT02184 [Mizuhopecten yessoensis]|uniref:FLYWCH-type domain-containing protein n=1 Tax=Mizuhopecten yessoensis TaxID=6573 RepID=A0A210PYG0_MIZYE|nr:hypothetical protein KP79_PYT02184 [Mizuhopecten yessoensis]
MGPPMLKRSDATASVDVIASFGEERCHIRTFSGVFDSNLRVISLTTGARALMYPGKDTNIASGTLAIRPITPPAFGFSPIRRLDATFVVPDSATDDPDATFPVSTGGDTIDEMNTKKETSMMLLSTFRTSQPMTTVLTSLSKTMMTRLAEQSLADALITDTVLEDEEVTWGVVDQGTNRRCRKLVSSDGYTYTVKGSTKTTTTWRCSVRNKKVWCRASVSQRGDVFTCGTIDHVHGSDNLAMKRVKVKTQVSK